MNSGKAKPCRWVYELSGRFPVESGVQSRPILRWSHRHVSNDGSEYLVNISASWHFMYGLTFADKGEKKVVKCKGMMQGGILGHFADCFECGVLFVCLFVCLFVGWLVLVLGPWSMPYETTVEHIVEWNGWIVVSLKRWIISNQIHPDPKAR